MGSIVLELQAEVLNSECDILTALRKAHVIASKLDLKAFDEWIMHELNGYFDVEDTEIPEYRKVAGITKAWNPYRGCWIPVFFEDRKYGDVFCRMDIRESISEIMEIHRKYGTHLKVSYSGEQIAFLEKNSNVPYQTNYHLQIDTHKLKMIVDSVTNRLLEWTMNLEKMGILGESMQFDQNEKDLAKNIPQTTNYYFGTVVNGDVKHAQLVSGDQNTITFNYNDAVNMIQAVKAALDEELPLGEARETADELLAEVEMKLSNQEKPGIIKAAIVGLQSFLISTGANVAGDLVTQFLQ